MASRGRRKGYHGRKTHQKSKSAPMSPRERRLLCQMAVCAAVFVLLVVGKVLLPGRMEPLNNRLSELLQQNMDVREVFSSVGRAASGAQGLGDTLDDVCQAVMQPKGEDAVEVAGSLDSGPEHPRALETLHAFGKQEGKGAAAPPAPVVESTAQKEEAATSLACVLYSQKNLPENVSMEQALLGFDYCTPVRGTLTSNFGYRNHPVAGEERFHYGIDIGAESGTEILCFAEGTVGAVGESNSYGKYVIVRHKDGYETLYAHCSRITVSSGAAVKRGEKIAEVGATGMATGPHLHLELHHNHQYLNPIYYVSLP